MMTKFGENVKFSEVPVHSCFKFNSLGQKMMKINDTQAGFVINSVIMDIYSDEIRDDEACTVFPDKEISIPILNKEEVERRASKIYTIIDGKIVDEPNYITTAYNWEPRFKGPCEENLEILKDISTLHSYGYYGLFKPSIAEVLAQIPDEIIDQVCAFEIIDSPKTADDLNKNIKILNAGFHVATTRLYAKTF